MQHIQDGQAQAHNGQVPVGDVHRGRRFRRVPGDEQPQHQPAKHQHSGGDHHRGDQGDHCGPSLAPLDALHLPGAQVLAHIGGHRKTVGSGGDFQQAVQLVGGGKSRQKQHPKPVDHRLHHHAPHGNDGVLQRRGGAQLQKQHRLAGGQAQVLPGNLQQGHPPDMGKTVHRRGPLGEHRGDGSPRNAPPEAHDEQKVQPHVEQGGHSHRVQGRFAVPQGPQDGGQQVVGHNHRDAAKHNPQIQQRPREDVRRGGQHLEHRPGGQLAGRRQQQGKSGAQGGAAPHRPGQFPVIFSAEMLSHEDGKPLGEPLDNAQHHPVEPVGGPQGGQGAHPHHLPHHGGIYHGVQLLEHVPHHQRQGKGDEQLCRRTLCHTADPFCHKTTPFPNIPPHCGAKKDDEGGSQLPGFHQRR